VTHVVPLFGRYYGQPNKGGGPVAMPTGYGQTVFMESDRPSTECGEAFVAEMVCPAVVHYCHSRGTMIRSVKVHSVEWQLPTSGADPVTGCLLPNDNERLSGCPNNGGVRMFPDKQAPNDGLAAVRRQIDLVATIDPRIEGVTVYFRVFDVDDPFDQLYGPQGLNSVPDAAVVDENGPVGNDNRGGPDPAVGTWSAVTNEFGQARKTITVSMQPGNNYRAAASVLQEALNQTTTIDGSSMTPQQNADSLSSYFESPTGRYRAWGDFEGYRVPVVWSKMLTVWRRVWLELDSMGPGSDISFTGTIDAIANDSPHTNDGTVELNVPDINDPGRFEGGMMAVPATESVYEIIDNLDATGDDHYMMAVPAASGHLGQSATVTDDDAFVLPRTPAVNLAVLNAKYKNCYVTFVEHAESRDLDTPFVATLPFSADVVKEKAQERRVRSTNSTPAEDSGCWGYGSGWLRLRSTRRSMPGPGRSGFSSSDRAATNPTDSRACPAS
jgi:hypothetical protein